MDYITYVIIGNINKHHSQYQQQEPAGPVLVVPAAVDPAAYLLPGIDTHRFGKNAYTGDAGGMNSPSL